MKYLLLAALMPGVLCAGEKKGITPTLKDSPRSKSASEIPSASASSMTAISAAIAIPNNGHARKRSKSELEIQSDNLWASPESSPASSCATSPTWVSPSFIRSPSQTKFLNIGSKVAPKKSYKMLNEADEKIWREQRGRLPRLQRSTSVPSNMSLHHQLLADSVKDASSVRHLARVAYSQEQTQRSLNEGIKNLKESDKKIDQFGGRLASLSIKLEGLFCQHATLVSAFEDTIADINVILKKLSIPVERSSNEQPTSPRGSVDSSSRSSSSSSSHRSRSNGSFKAPFTFGHKEHKEKD